MRIYLDNSNIFANFGAWIGGSCKPSDKGKLTTFPRFKNCQHKSINVSSMLKFEELPKIKSERWLSLEDLPGEVWKPVVGREKRLMVSNYARVKRNEYYLEYKDGRSNRYKEIIYRPAIKKDGYLGLCINTGDGIEYFKVHRLVAQAFIPNPNNYPYINHKDENPLNNIVYVNPDGSVDLEKSNLEWCTPAYNINYGNCSSKIKLSSIRNGIAIGVAVYDYDGHYIKKYDTEHDAARELGISLCAIQLCCKGRALTALGLHMRFFRDPYEKRDLSGIKKLSAIIGGEERLLSSLNAEDVFKNMDSIRSCLYREGVVYKKNNIVDVIFITPNCPIIRIKNKRKTYFEYLKT